MEKQNEEYDEINLYDLWKAIAKRKMLIIGLFIVIVGSTAIGSFMMPNIYRGETVLSLLIDPKLISAEEITNMLGNIDRPKQLKMVPKSESDVTNITLNTIVKERKKTEDKLVVTIDAKNIDIIPEALSEVIGYLNNMDFIKDSVSRNKEILIMLKAELSDLIKNTPDLKATYYKLIEAGNLTTTQFDPIAIEQKIIDIKIQLLSIDQQILRLNNNRGFEIAMQPYISDKPVGPKIPRNIILASIVSLFVGIFLALLIEFIGNNKNRNNYSSGNHTMD